MRGRGLQGNARAARSQGVQAVLPIGAFIRPFATDQVARGALEGDAVRAIAHAQGRKTQPQTVLRAGERHVQKAQVFAQPVRVGLGELRVAELQQHLALSVVLR